MSKLKNMRHEEYCQELMQGTTQKAAYLEAYDKCTPDSAEAASTRLMHREDIKSRCLEILNNRTGLKLDIQLDNLQKLSQADKSIVVDKVLAQVEDNPTRLEATKTILKLYGLLGNVSEMPTVDARSVTISLEGTELSHLDIIISKLQSIGKRTDNINGNVVNPTQKPDRAEAE